MTASRPSRADGTWPWESPPSKMNVGFCEIRATLSVASFANCADGSQLKCPKGPGHCLAFEVLERHMSFTSPRFS
eukprot:6157437-Pleurochrysis_carterae.AAC.2